MLSRQKHLLHEPCSLSSVLKTIKPEGGYWLHSYPDLHVPSVTSSPHTCKEDEGDDAGGDEEEEEEQLQNYSAGKRWPMQLLR